MNTHGKRFDAIAEFRRCCARTWNDVAQRFDLLPSVDPARAAALIRRAAGDLRTLGVFPGDRDDRSNSHGVMAVHDLLRHPHLQRRDALIIVGALMRSLEGRFEAQLSLMATVLDAPAWRDAVIDAFPGWFRTPRPIGSALQAWRVFAHRAWDDLTPANESETVDQVATTLQHLQRTGLEDAPDVRGENAPFLACMGLRPAVIDGFLQHHGRSVNDLRNARGETPLHALARFDGNGERIRLLLRRGADPLAADSEGCTPLDIAVSAAHRSWGGLATLLDTGAYSEEALRAARLRTSDPQAHLVIAAHRALGEWRRVKSCSATIRVKPM